MNKMTKFGIVGILLVSLVAGAYAFGPAFGNEDTRAAARAAMQNNDYDAWNAAHNGIGNEERFAQARDHYTEMQEHRAEMDEIFESGDYDKWAEEMKGMPCSDMISEENFETFAKMHEARMNGDYATADDLAEKLGLSQNKMHNMMNRGTGKGRNAGRGNQMGGFGMHMFEE